MKALIRNEGETVTQDMRLTFIDWDTGAPLTDSDWYGGPYALIEYYTPPQVQISDKEREIVELKARLAALEKEV